MNFKKLIATAALALATAFAQATPVFTGETYANFGTNPGPASSNAAGYYLWSQNAGQDWSLRWTGNNYGSSAWYRWYGYITLTNAVDGSLVKVQFESNDSASMHTNVFGSSLDVIQFNGNAGPLYDGINFRVNNPAGYQVIDFALGSTLFGTQTEDLLAQNGRNIFIGQNFAVPQVQYQRLNQDNPSDLRQVARFQVAQVAEPGTLALLGLGLAGLGIARRKQKA